MPDCQHHDRIACSIESILPNVAGSPKRDDQIGKAVFSDATYRRMEQRHKFVPLLAKQKN